jgi:peptide/nickel transport system substrate-binding protein
VPGQEWVFEANRDFPEALGGRPYLDRIVYRAIPEQTTLLTELFTGGIDVFLQPSPSFAGQIEASPDTRLVTTPFRQYDYIAWNTRRPQFRDPRVRRALTMALDRAQLVAALRHGYGEVGRGTVTPAHWAFDPEDPETLLPHDPEGARRLLAEAGWEPGPDGVLRDREGNPFRFTLVTNAGNDVRRDAAEIAQAQLRPLGIVVQPRQLEFTTMLSMLQGRLDGSGRRVRDFDAVIGGWVVFFRQDDADILHCRAVDGPFQYVGYCNPRVDALIDTLAVVMDREEARPLWREYQRLIVRESPYTVLFYHTQITGVRTRLRDVTIDIRGETARARDWWVAPARR